MVARRLFIYPSMRWENPFAELDRISRQMNRMSTAVLSRPGMHWMSSKVFPAVNLTEDAEKAIPRQITVTAG